MALADSAGIGSRRPRIQVGSFSELLNVLEWFRLVVEFLFVIPTAKYLPLSAGLAVADVAGWIDALIPSAAGRTARREMSASTGRGGWAGYRLSALRLGAERRRLVYRWRIAEGRERRADWTVVESGTEELKRIRAAGESLIVATGHFNSGVGSLFRDMLIPTRVTVSGSRTWRLSPFDFRRHLRSPRRIRQGLRIAVPDHWSRNYDWTRAPERLSTQAAMVEELAQPGGIVSIYIDAYWEKAGSYRRPFAGHADRGFALGAARTARLVQCPIVPYIVTLGDAPRTVHLEGGPVITPAAPGDESADRDVLDQALNWLESAVARHAAQYPASGFARQWNAATEQWEEPET